MFVLQLGVLIIGFVNAPQLFAIEVGGNAGCLIRSENRVVLVKDIWTKKYGLPGGHPADTFEPLAETAVRETKEETGIEASAQRHLATSSNYFHIYDCQPRGGEIETIGNQKVQVPLDSFNEIEEVVVLDPSQIPAKQWRFPEQQKLLLDLIPLAHSYEIVEKKSHRLPPAIEMELEWMQKLQQIGNRFWNSVFGFFSFLGGEAFALLLIPVVCFLVNPRKGLELTFLCITSVLVGGLFKKFFQIPRPFYYLPILQKEPASGFGFPSGHTQMVTLVWTWMALQFPIPGRWVWVALIAVLGGLARVYLGVHFFHDVVGGWCAALLILGVYSFFLRRNGLSYLPLKTWYAALGVMGALGLIVSPTPEIVAVSSVFLGLLGTLWKGAGLERSLEAPVEWRTRVFLFGTVLGGMQAISALALWIPISGAFLPHLLVRIAKYFALGAFVGLLAGRVRGLAASLQGSAL